MKRFQMYKKGEGNYPVMPNNDSIPVGCQHKDPFTAGYDFNNDILDGCWRVSSNFARP